MSRVLVKCGGAAASLGVQELTGQLTAAGHEVCVVHGAGPQISEEMRRRGLEVQFVEGRRVTSDASLDIVREALMAVNELLCTSLGDRAVGLMGDAIGLKARRLPELGLVGNALPSRPAAVLDALAAGSIPVVAPLAEGPLNVNADEAAVALAAGLAADRILFLTDVPGVLVDGKVVDTLVADDVDQMLADGVFEGGIVPKLRAAVNAARLGMAAGIGKTAVVVDGPVMAADTASDEADQP